MEVEEAKTFRPYVVHVDEKNRITEVEGSSPESVVAVIKKAGYDPVWKDFDRAFDNVPR